MSGIQKANNMQDPSPKKKQMTIAWVIFLQDRATQRSGELLVAKQEGGFHIALT
jgi:hypothetical protein